MIEAIVVGSRKYIIQLIDNGKQFKAYRYGEEWRDLTGDGLILAMFQRIQELQTDADNLHSWVQAALHCPTWHWDKDQRSAAESVLAEYVEHVQRELHGETL